MRAVRTIAFATAGLPTKISAASSGRSMIVDLPTPMLMRCEPAFVPAVTETRGRAGASPVAASAMAPATATRSAPASTDPEREAFRVVMSLSSVVSGRRISAPAIGWRCRSG